MARIKALEICKNIKQTLGKENTQTCYKYTNPMFDKPQVHQGVLKRKLKELIKEYNIKKEEL